LKIERLKLKFPAKNWTAIMRFGTKRPRQLVLDFCLPVPTLDLSLSCGVPVQGGFILP
jgi:hypothetical protein